MAEKSGLDKAISYVGILVSVVGILLTVFFFFILNGLIDGIHSSAIAEVDSAIGIMQDVGVIVDGTANSVDSFSSFAQNASGAMNETASAVEGMSTAMNALATGVSSIPLMPGDVSGALHDSASQIRDTADYMKETSFSMQNVSGNAISTATGVQQLKEDVHTNIAALEQAKRQIDDMHTTAQIALILGTVLIVLVFILNGMNFYKQLKE